jgi:hypothetical protein
MRFGPVLAVCLVVVCSTAVLAQSSVNNASIVGTVSTIFPLRSVSVGLLDSQCAPTGVSRLVEPSCGIQLVNQETPQRKASGEDQKIVSDHQAVSSGLWVFANKEYL